MIKTIKKGGLTSVVVSIVVIALVGLIPLSNLYFYTFENAGFNQPVVKFIVPVIMVVTQAIWFQRVVHKSRFFDQWSTLPAVVYVAIICLLPDQLHHWDTLAVNYVWLVFYQKLFYDNDEVTSNSQIFMDIGILMCVRRVYLPESPSIYCPSFTYLLNQFTASNLNKFFIVLLSFVLVVFSTIGIGYFFVSPEWVVGLPERLIMSLDISTLFNSGKLYTYITLFATLLIVSPVMYNQLSFMQTKNRSVVNMLFLQIFMVLGIAVFSGQNAFTTMHLVALPLSFTLSFGMYHIKKRWLANLGVLFALFALVLIQLEYIKL